MFKAFAFAAALALILSGCSTGATQQFATAVAAINSVNAALIQLNANVVANTTQLAGALASVECPVVNASVALGASIAADPAVAANVKSALTKAGSAGALASDLCVAAGFSSSAIAGTK